MCKISVIIPVYNMEKYVKECLDSVVNQTIDDIEIWVVDDGSTDESLKIIAEYQKEYHNIKVYSQDNQGQAVAKNYAINHAKGKYIMVLDPDDYYPNKDCLRLLFERAEEQNALICGGIMLDLMNGKESITEKEVALKYYINRYVSVEEYNDIYHHQRYMFNREFLVKNGIFFPVYRRFEDPPFTMKAMITAGGFYATNVEIYVHRVGYKRIKYSKNMCFDILCGIRDVVETCSRNQLSNIYERILKNFIKNYFVCFYCYLNRGHEDVDRVINEIAKLFKDWKSNETFFIQVNEAHAIQKECIEEYDLIRKIADEGKDIILYGAGAKTCHFLDIFQNRKWNILGIAVTNDNATGMLENHSVKHIDEYLCYSKEAIVLITTLDKYHDEIYELLVSKGFTNIIKVDVKKIECAVAILNEVKKQ